MARFEDRAKALVATAAKLAHLQGADTVARLLTEAIATLVQTGSQESFDGNTLFYTLMLEVPIPTYAAIDDDREGLERLIRNRIAQLVRTEPGNAITEVVISPILAEEARPIKPSAGEELEEETPSFWQAGFFRLFISHTAANKERVHRLKESLAAYQVAAFVAHDDIEPTVQWMAEIERALRTMDAMSAILTPDFYQSMWCDQEIGIAFGRGKLVVPLCKGADPHGFLGKYQGFKTGELPASAVAEKLVDILIRHSLTAERMADAFVDRMATSKSFEASRRTMTLIEKLTHLNSSQVTKLVESIQANRQVGNVVGLPERIQRLVSQIGRAPSV